MEYQDRVLKQREQLNASGRQELHYLVEPKGREVHTMTEARWLPASLVDRQLLQEYRQLQRPTAEMNLAVTAPDSAHEEKLVEDFYATRILHEKLGVNKIRKKKARNKARSQREQSCWSAVVLNLGPSRRCLCVGPIRLSVGVKSGGW